MSDVLVAALPAALLAGLVAVAVTVAVERWGGVIGGLLGTLPTTIVPASLGIWSGAAERAGFEAAMLVVPAGMLIDAVFLWSWRAAPPRLPGWPLGARLAAMIVLSLGIWAAGATALVLGEAPLVAAGVSLRALSAAALALTIGIGAWACRSPQPAPRGSRRVGPGTLALRGCLAASAIGLSVWLAAVGGEVLAGVVSVFPAIFLTTMVALWLAQGEAVPSGAVGPMMLGASSVSAYAVLTTWTFPNLGLVAGAAVAWLGAVGAVSLPAWLWLRRRA